MPLIVLLKLVLTEHYNSLSCTIVLIIFMVILDVTLLATKVSNWIAYIFTQKKLGNFSHWNHVNKLV